MRSLKWFFVYFILTACIDRIDFDTPPANYLLVVDGMITDDPGPHKIYLYRAMPLDADLDFRVPVFNAKLTLVTNETEEELLTETQRGTYETKSSTRGKRGNTYKIKIQTSDGRLYESDPEKILDPGEIKNVRFEFESKTVIQNGAEVNADQFNILIDAQGVPNTDNYLRWKSIGTYQIETFPQLKVKNVDGGPIPDPLSCSGYEFRNGNLIKLTDCACCQCWVTEYEEIPKVSDDQFVQGSAFNNVEVTSVPITRRTFYNKYYVEIQQMNISKKAFDYWKLIEAQKVGTASLFQPPAAKLRGNVRSLTNSSEEVLGYFMATSLYRKGIFITKEDVPYKVRAIDTLRMSCLGYNTPNSTNVKPAFWK